MRVECAWCDSPLESGTGVDEDHDRVSHGVCPKCEVGLIGHLGISLDRYLEGFDFPVLAVDVERGGRVTTGNRRALEALGQRREEVQDRLFGDVYECRNASLPGGCGETVHCSGCTIRKSLEHTWRTGEPLQRVPATLRPVESASTRHIELEISTKRLGDRVLLRIDRPPPQAGNPPVANPRE